jgi:hypothetical protein
MTTPGIHPLYAHMASLITPFSYDGIIEKFGVLTRAAYALHFAPPPGAAEKEILVAFFDQVEGIRMGLGYNKATEMGTVPFDVFYAGITLRLARLVYGSSKALLPFFSGYHVYTDIELLYDRERARAEGTMSATPLFHERSTALERINWVLSEYPDTPMPGLFYTVMRAAFALDYLPPPFNAEEGDTVRNILEALELLNRAYVKETKREISVAPQILIALPLEALHIARKLYPSDIRLVPYIESVLVHETDELTRAYYEEERRIAEGIRR